MRLEGTPEEFAVLFQVRNVQQFKPGMTVPSSFSSKLEVNQSQALKALTVKFKIADDRLQEATK